MDNKVILIGYSSPDRQRIINSQESRRSISNVSRISSIFDSKVSKRRFPFLPKLNQRSWRSLLFWLRSRNFFTVKWGLFGLVLFAILAMIVGILTVYFTASKPMETCVINFKEVRGGLSINDSRPVSVAVGHFNNDTWLDIAVANSGANTIGIFLGQSNGSFATQMTYSIGIMSRPISIGVGDFNNDHSMDIVVANYDSHTVSVLLGYGNGTFDKQIPFFTGHSRPLSIAIGDFNNDKWLDIVVVNNGTNTIDILLGKNNGSFRIQNTYSTGYDSYPYSVVVGYFNKDKHLDIAVANYGTNNIGIFLGYGDGSFTPQTTFSTSLRSGPYSLAVGDFNNDDHLDIIVASYHADNISLFLGYGNGTFAKQQTYFLASRSNPCFVAVGYINEDDHLDVVVSHSVTNSISVLSGNGDGTFAAPTKHSLNTESNPIGLAIGNFNNNKQSDVVVANSGTNNIVILRRYTELSDKDPPTYPTGGGSLPWQVAVSHFNNDNYLDVAVINYGTNSIGIFLGHGNGSFEKQVEYSTGIASRPMGLAIADFNNDSYSDIIVANFNVGYATLLLGYGNGSFNVTKSFTYEESSSPKSIAVGDFNNDNQLDAVLTTYSNNGISIFLGNKNETFEYLETYVTGVGSRPSCVTTGDFNNDNHLDIIVANTVLDNIGIFLGYGNGTFAEQRIYSTGEASVPQTVSLGHFNNDSCLDIAVANSANMNVGVFLGYCDGTFTKQVTYSTDLNSFPWWVTVGDVNNDQWLDIIVANQAASNIGIFLGYGNGTFATQRAFSSGFNSLPSCVVVGNVNNDSRNDVIIANYGTGNIAVLLGHDDKGSENQIIYSTTSNLHSDLVTVEYSNNSDQHHINVTNSMSEFRLGDYYLDFEEEIFYSTDSSSRPYSIVVADFNNDTYLDIIVSNSGKENIGILLGYGNGSFRDEMIHSIGSGSRPQYILTGHFNKDDYLDIAVANSLNDNVHVLLGYGNGSFREQLPISTGSGSYPNSMASGDLNNDGWLDIVVANTERDTVGLILGFNYTSFETPSRFTTGTTSGPKFIAIADFNNDNQIDIVSANYNTNNVAVLLGFGNGTFTPPKMYAQVNQSHPWSVATGDFNKDNKIDITIAMWATNQMGVILGNGDGTFGEPILYSTGFGSRPVGITVGDFNNDHQLDIATANFGASTVSVFLGYGNGTFTEAMIYSTGYRSGPQSISVNDLNKDNYLDIIVANEVNNSIGVLYGYGNGSFRTAISYSANPNSSPYYATNINFSPYYAASSDFNNDTFPDLAVGLFGTGDVGVLLGYGNETFSPVTLYTSGFDSGIYHLAFNDLNNDNYIDIVVASLTAGDIGVLFGNGDGTFKSAVLYPYRLGTALTAVAIADLNNDTRLDIVFAVSSANDVGVFLANGFQPFGGHKSLLYMNGSSPSSVAIGDLNNDACLDIAIANYGTNNLGILFGDGKGSFEHIEIHLTDDGSEPMSILLTDFNNDTLLDIVFAMSKTSNIGVFLGAGNRTFQNLTIYSTGFASFPIFITVVDFNNDNITDIIVANNAANSLEIFIGYGNGSFAERISYSIGYGSGPYSIASGDFNSDSWIDIGVANHISDTIKILFNCPQV